MIEDKLFRDTSKNIPAVRYWFVLHTAADIFSPPLCETVSRIEAERAAYSRTLPPVGTATIPNGYVPRESWTIILFV